MIYSEKELAYTLGFDLGDLCKVTKNIDSYYKGFSEIKYDKNGKPKVRKGKIQKRYFKSSQGDLRKLQDRLLNRILVKVPLLPNLKGGMKGESGVINAKVHKGNEFIFQTDIQSFYPSISRKMVYQALRSKAFSKQVANLITDLTVIESGDSLKGETLPQGTPTSPILSNIVFERTVKQVFKIFKDQKIELTTWIDDLTISSNEDFQSSILDVIKIMGNNGFKISRKKTTYRHGKTIITGVLIGHSTMKVTNDFRNRETEGLTDMQIDGRQAYKDYIYRIDKNL